MWMRLLLAVSSIGCNSQALPAASENLALGCYGAIRGDFTAELGGDWTPIGTLRSTTIELTCRGAGARDPAAPDFSLFMPSAAGDFSSGQGTLVANQGKSWFRGACSGTVTSSPERVGDLARGRFSCSALTGIVDTPATNSVTISDGSFDLPMQMPPPE